MDGVYAENRRERFQRISMDGVYAENRREQFQRISMDGVTIYIVSNNFSEFVTYNLKLILKSILYPVKAILLFVLHSLSFC